MKIFFGLCFFMLSVTSYAQSKDSLDKQPDNQEIEAEFPGGTKAWLDYIRKNLDSNIPVRNKAPKGSYLVIVRFIVEKDGKIGPVMAETKHGYGMEEEAIRVITNSPDWIPARQNGKFVNAYRRQPIAFKLGRR